MKTILVFEQHRALRAEIDSVLKPGLARLLVAANVPETESLLVRELIDLALVDGDAPDAVDLAHRLRQSNSRTPILAVSHLAEAVREKLHAAGVTQVVSYPASMDWFISPAGEGAEKTIPFAPSFSDHRWPASAAAGENSSGLGVHLNPSAGVEELLRTFGAEVRRRTGVNRLWIFLRAAETSALGVELRPVFTAGVEPLLARQLTLPLRQGIAQILQRTGRLLPARECESGAALGEFRLAGASVALPIIGPDGFMGVALLDDRVTGESLGSAELTAVFSALEELGVMLHGRQLRDELATGRALIEDILRQLDTGCAVLRRDLEPLHANEAARLFLSPGAATFTLPPAVRQKVEQVFQTGSAIGPERFLPADRPDAVFDLHITPFRRPGNLVETVLLIIKDRREIDLLHKLEVDGASAALLKTMAERFAHEIGNSLVPISTHQQLLAERWLDPEFRTSLSGAMSETVTRIKRLANQMLFLSGGQGETGEPVDATELVASAFREAETYHNGKPGRLDFQPNGTRPRVRGSERALRYAFAEIMLNALQANPEKPQVSVRLHERSTEFPPRLEIEISDSGPGFSADIAGRAPEPFFSTRNVGLGLGLTVCRTILEANLGRLEAVPGEGVGVVRVSLPVA